MRMALLALDGVFDTGLSAFLDTFSTANELAAMRGDGKPPFDVQLVGVNAQIRTAMGLTAVVLPLRDMPRPDWFIVPALNAKQPDQLVAALDRPDVAEALPYLRNWHEQGSGIAAACVGTFLLGEAGLLDDRNATTTWSLAPLFRQRYPKARLDESRMIVSAGQITTAGSAMGHVDLALSLIRQASPDLAALVARFMLIDRRPSQASYIIPDFLAHADPLVERFERWARKNLATGFSLIDAAQALAVTPRTLQRRTDAVLGKSPLAFFQDMRVEHARHLVALGGNLGDIAAAVGYADSRTLLALLRRRLGRGVTELRREQQA